MTTKNRAITVLQLRRIINNIGEFGEVDCFVQTSLGRSSKHIIVQTHNHFTVINEIDDSEDEYTDVYDMFEKNKFIRNAFENDVFGIYGYEIGRFKGILK